MSQMQRKFSDYQLVLPFRHRVWDPMVSGLSSKGLKVLCKNTHDLLTPLPLAFEWLTSISSSDSNCCNCVFSGRPPEDEWRRMDFTLKALELVRAESFEM